MTEAPHWRGINHLAMVTPDMDATVRFYHGVLGMRLVTTLRAGPMRHYFFELGAENTIAFFEWEGAKTFSKAAGMPTRKLPMQFDHLAFNVADEDALVSMQQRLTEAGCEVTHIVDHNVVKSIYFNDPHGIALEASYWVHDATGPATVDYTDVRYFADMEPVAAVRELADKGALDWLPKTTLTGTEIPDPV